MSLPLSHPLILSPTLFSPGMTRTLIHFTELGFLHRNIFLIKIWGWITCKTIFRVLDVLYATILYPVKYWVQSEIQLRQIQTCEDMDHSLNRSSWNHNAAVYIFQYNWIEPGAFGNHKDLKWHLLKIDLLKAVKNKCKNSTIDSEASNENLFFILRCCFGSEHDLGSFWQGKGKNKTSKLHYVIELFFLAPFFVSLLFFSTRRHSISLLSTDSRTLCYLILFWEKIHKYYPPHDPNRRQDTELQVCKLHSEKNEVLLKLPLVCV